MRRLSKTTAPRAGVSALIAAALWLTACASDDATPEDPPPSPTAEQEVSPAPGDSTEHEAEESIEATSPQPLGEFSTAAVESDQWPNYTDTFAIYPTDVRAAIHDGFERIVIEHHGSGEPSYLAHYTDEPAEPGIGTIVDTGDEAYLEVVISGTTPSELVAENDPRYDTPGVMLDHGTEITDLNTQATGTVVSFAPWEATSNYIIGLDAQRPYAVTMLEDPLRLVIDIELDD